MHKSSEVQNSKLNINIFYLKRKEEKEDHCDHCVAALHRTRKYICDHCVADL